MTEKRSRYDASTEGRAALVGRATGAILLALFGFIWALGCAGVVTWSLIPALLTASTTAILVVGGLRLRGAAGRLPERDAAFPDADRTWQRFRLVGIAEGVGIGIVVFACAKLGRPELIPAAVAFVVGLHFFPLALLFRVPLYHATGAALCLIAAATPIVASPSGVQSLAWRVVPGLGAAAILWATSAILIIGGPGTIRRGA